MIGQWGDKLIQGATFSSAIPRSSFQNLPLHQDILHLVSGRDYFVITTNVDRCFQKAHFEKSRLFYTQGDYGLFQCSVPCHRATYDNEEAVRRMAEWQSDMRIPSDLIPLCPKCGKPMAMNLRSDERFVEDEGWHEACAHYEDFVTKHEYSRILLLELGVGGNTPGIIKYPFWRLAARNENATYACINKGEAFCLGEIRDRAILIDADIGDTPAALGAAG